MRRRGFTLIEVLVVVAIIALLVSILMPSLAVARKRGRATACLSNMRELGLAAQMYTVTWKGWLVDYGLAHGGSVDEDTTWFNTLRRDYGNKLVARCPDDDSPYWTEPYPDTTQKRRVSYGVNEYVTGRIANYEQFRRIDVIKRTATTILFCEITHEGEYAVSDHVHAVNWSLNPEEEARKQIEMDLHLGKANYVFADGHTEPLAFAQTYAVGSRQRIGAKMEITWKHNLYDPKIAY